MDTKGLSYDDLKLLVGPFHVLTPTNLVVVFCFQFKKTLKKNKETSEQSSLTKGHDILSIE